MRSFKIGDINVPVPIIQGGMGIGISMSQLASAVANMGGVGIIATVGLGLLKHETGANFKKNNIDALREEIRKARKSTNGVLGVNIMTVLTNFSDMVRTSIEEGIDIIFSGAGLPLDLPGYLKKDSKTRLVPIVSSARAASIISKKWKQNYDYLPDAFVVEGPKAGGHLGFKPNQIENEDNKLENLVTEVLEVANEIKEKYDKEIPVIAAGGVFTGEDIFQLIEQGVSAVQLGTRFAATEECDASDEFKKALVNAGERDVKIIKSPVGMPGRAISNQFILDSDKGERKPSSCKYHCIKSCNPKTTSFCISQALLEAYKGNLKDGFVFTGSNADKIKEIVTVKEVFLQLRKEYEIAKNKREIKNKPIVYQLESYQY